jgi:hypothetical protein
MINNAPSLRAQRSNLLGFIEYRSVIAILRLAAKQSLDVRTILPGTDYKSAPAATCIQISLTRLLYKNPDI